MRGTEGSQPHALFNTIRKKVAFTALVEDLKARYWGKKSLKSETPFQKIPPKIYDRVTFVKVTSVSSLASKI